MRACWVALAALAQALMAYMIDELLSSSGSQSLGRIQKNRTPNSGPKDHIDIRTLHPGPKAQYERDTNPHVYVVYWACKFWSLIRLWCRLWSLVPQRVRLPLFRLSGPKKHTLRMFFWSRILKYWILGPSRFLLPGPQECVK